MPVDEQQLPFVQQRMPPPAPDVIQVRAERRPHLRPAVRRRLSEGAGMFIAENRQEGVVVDLDEFLSPIQHDG